MKKEFDSEYANVKFDNENNVVVITWKQFCCYDDYRKPTTFALDLLNIYTGSNLIVDARNGFEDNEDDVEWGFHFLLPAMSKTGCKKVGFIMETENTIETEMDMWTLEFGKYFAVFREKNYEKLLEAMKTMIWVNVTYQVKKGLRDEFYEMLQKNNTKKNSSEEPGNYRYEYTYALDSENIFCLNEIWTNQEAIDLHMKKDYYLKLQDLKAEYVNSVVFEKYIIQNL